MSQAIHRLRELLEQGYVPVDVSSSDGAVHVAVANGALAAVVTLGREDIRAILTGEAEIF